MNLKELKELIDWNIRLVEQNHEDPEKIRVGIVVKRVGQIGSQPVVDIKTLGLGFDWDKGKLLIYPESDLREIDRDEFAALRKKYDDMGWQYMEKVRKTKK